MIQAKEKSGCPVCGYRAFSWLDASGSTTFEICDSCGCQSGYEFDQDTVGTRLLELRRKWLIGEGGVWKSKAVQMPSDWNPVKQLREAHLDIPL